MDSGPLTYAKVLGLNLAVARTRRDLSQEDVAERMRNLGYTTWARATVSKSERGTRPVTAAEIIGLALTLKTNTCLLLAPPQDESIQLGDGELVSEDARALVFGRNNGAVRWDGNRPIFGKGVNAWRGEMEDDPARGLE